VILTQTIDKILTNINVALQTLSGKYTRKKL